MKRNVFYILTVLCSLSFLLSCSDDEDTSWKNITADYPQTDVTLKLNGLALSEKSVKVVANNAENATITLTNPVEGISTLTIEAKLKKVENNYTFESNSTQQGYAVVATGTITEAKKLIMDMTIGDVFAQEGVYRGDMVVNASDDSADNITMPQKVYINKTGDRVIQLQLKNFAFGTLTLGDIEMNDIVALTAGNKTDFSGTGTLNIPVVGSCELEAKGTIEGEKITLNIAVNASVLGLTVNVDFKGDKMAKDMSSLAAITKFSFDSEFVVEQPVITEQNISFSVADTIPAEELQKLVPTIEISANATITPASGVAQDFSKPVVYTVVSEDGITTTTYTVSSQKIGFYGFESWTVVKSSTSGSTEEYETPTGMFGTSNPGAVMLNEMASQVGSNFGYPVMSTEGKEGKGAKIQTLHTAIVTSDGSDFNAALGGMIPYITSGSLFSGAFKLNMFDALSSTKFGVPHYSKPLTFSGWYKYTPGKVYYSSKNEEVEGEVDKCSIYAVLYEEKLDTKGENISLTGHDITTSDRVVMKAVLEDGSAKADWTSFSLPFNLVEGKTYDASKNYYLAFICSSSAKGDAYEGAPGSVLIVDNLEIISE